MDITTFWNFIEATRKKRTSSWKITWLKEQLEKMSRNDFISFSDIFDDLMKQSYRADLWIAAEIIQNSCSDDNFDDFRSWLIFQWKDVFTDALNNPDSLAKLWEKKLKLSGESEWLLYGLAEISESLFGSDIRRCFDDPKANLKKKLIGDMDKCKEVEFKQTHYPQLLAIIHKKKIEEEAAFQAIDFQKIDPEWVLPDWLRQGHYDSIQGGDSKSNLHKNLHCDIDKCNEVELKQTHNPKIFDIIQKKNREQKATFQAIDFQNLDPEWVLPDWLSQEPRNIPQKK